MDTRLVTDPQEIYTLLLADPAFTEAVHYVYEVQSKRHRVYILGDDGSKRYITELEMKSDD